MRSRQASEAHIEEVQSPLQPTTCSHGHEKLPLRTISEIRPSNSHTASPLSVSASISATPPTSGSARSILTTDNEKVLTIRERLGGYLHPRDMRRLVIPFSASNEPELMVRRHVMLLNFDPLRAIVLRDRLLVLVPDGADSILINLEKMVHGGIDEMEKFAFGESEATGTEVNVSGIEISRESGGRNQDDDDDQYLSLDDSENENDSNDLSYHDNEEVRSNNDMNISQTEFNFDNEWEEFEQGGWIKLAFELQSVDAILSSAVKMLSEESLSLRKRIFKVMEEMRGNTNKRTSVPGDHVQEQLRILKDKVREMEGRVQGFVRAINQILDDEEDMSLMNLSRLISHPDRFIQPVAQHILDEESDEPELILEVYLQQALSEVNALELLKGNILNTEELVSLQMDTVRNRLLYINTVVSVVSLSVASASLVGSIFGMNLTNHMENDPNTFKEVVGGTIAGCAIMLTSVMWLISKTGVMPANTQKRLYSRRRVDIQARSLF